MNDLRLASVGMVQGSEDVPDDGDLLVVSECQAALLDVLAQALASDVFGNEGEPIPCVLVVEELPDRENVGMTGKVRQRSECVADELHLPLALIVGQVGVDLIDAKTRGAAAPCPEERVPRTVLGIAVGPAELLLDLPVAVARRRALRLRTAHDGLLDHAKLCPDVRGEPG